MAGFTRSSAHDELEEHSNQSDVHHPRYSDSEASAAAPVQSVNGKTGDVTVDVETIGYVQTSRPAYDENETWLNPEKGIFYAAYDAGNGGDWHPIPPVTVLEETVTFTESDVTVSTDDSTQISNGSIVLGSGYTFNRGGEDTTSSMSVKTGPEINANADVNQLNVGMSPSTDATTCYLLDSGHNVIESTSISGGEATLTTTLTAGNTYYVMVDSGGSSYTSGANYGTPTGSNPDFDVTAWYEGTSTSNSSYSIESIESVNPRTDGTATVEWSYPSEIRGWDLATFQRTLDGESVQVDVQSYDGSSWVTEYSDISQNFDISPIADSTNVRLRATLSRSNTSNNPTLDYAARRFSR